MKTIFPGDWHHIVQGMVGGVLFPLAAVAQSGVAVFDPWKIGAYVILGAIAGWMVPDKNPLVVVYHGLTLPSLIALLKSH